MTTRSWKTRRKNGEHLGGVLNSIWANYLVSVQRTLYIFPYFIYKITAQIHENAKVRANKNSATFCIKVVIIVDSLQFDVSISLWRFVNKRSFISVAFLTSLCIDFNLWLLSDDVGWYWVHCKKKERKILHSIKFFFCYCSHQKQTEKISSVFTKWKKWHASDYGQDDNGISRNIQLFSCNVGEIPGKMSNSRFGSAYDIVQRYFHAVSDKFHVFFRTLIRTYNQTMRLHCSWIMSFKREMTLFRPIYSKI